MKTEKNKTKEILQRYGVHKSEPDFKHAVKVIDTLSEQNRMNAEQIIKILAENKPWLNSGFSLSEEIIKLECKIKENTKKIDEYEKTCSEIKEKVKWLLKVPLKRKKTVDIRIGNKVHEKLINLYYMWKTSEAKEKLKRIHEENDKLKKKCANLLSIRRVLSAFEDIQKNSALSSNAEKKGVKLIEKCFSLEQSTLYPSN